MYMGTSTYQDSLCVTNIAEGKHGLIAEKEGFLCIQEDVLQCCNVVLGQSGGIKGRGRIDRRIRAVM